MVYKITHFEYNYSSGVEARGAKALQKVLICGTFKQNPKNWTLGHRSLDFCMSDAKMNMIRK